MLGKREREIRALVQVGSPQRWRGEGSHLSRIKLCKVGMGESATSGQQEARTATRTDRRSIQKSSCCVASVTATFTTRH